MTDSERAAIATVQAMHAAMCERIGHLRGGIETLWASYRGNHAMQIERDANREQERADALAIVLAMAKRQTVETT